MDNWDKIKCDIEYRFLCRLNRNQWRDIKRLLFEIAQRENVRYSLIIEELSRDKSIFKFNGRNRFFGIKQHLIKRRFPLSSSYQKIDTKSLFLAEVKSPLEGENDKKQFSDFRPQKLFVEKSALGTNLFNNFTKTFPKIPVEELKYCGEYIKKHKFNIKDLKNPYIFIVKERWDFLKPCPCTKKHLRCNYWILNIGMGCPFDCSYCFLQSYANFPGIVLPANLDAFFSYFNKFYKNLKYPIRIGTGEFTDSLSLDHITHYSTELVNFFKDKKVYFEFKTKSNRIDNLIKTKGYPNIVVAWSINPQPLIDSEEKGTSSLKERLRCAKLIREKGFSLAFHFDPIIHSSNWNNLYKQLIEELYKELKPPFQWISLGTFRGNRELKNIGERRFPESKIFYGELLLDKDKKLRYPRFLRENIYKIILSWIREFDSQTPVYLCMEDIHMWHLIKKGINSPPEAEKYILSNF